MNHFPQFDPNVQATVQLTSTRLNSVSLGQKSNQIQPGVGYRVTQTPGGTTVSAIRKRGGGASAATCSFGEIVTYKDGEETKRGISGGIIYCGDQNWNISPQYVNPDADGDWLVYLTVEVIANMDDDTEIILPGINTGTRPTGDWDKLEWEEDADYPENTQPTIPTGEGTIIIPLGRLTIADKGIAFAKVGCGNITIGQCGAVLSHTRA